jgi:hypothetical protein
MEGLWTSAQLDELQQRAVLDAIDARVYADELAQQAGR